MGYNEFIMMQFSSIRNVHDSFKVAHKLKVYASKAIERKCHISNRQMQ